MCSLKANGGLTRDTGMGEKERLVWLLSMPACAEMNASLQFLTDVSVSLSVVCAVCCHTALVFDVMHLLKKKKKEFLLLLSIPIF